MLGRELDPQLLHTFAGALFRSLLHGK